MTWFQSQRSEADFEAFVQRSARSLLRTAYLLTADLGLAEDLVQETLAKVAQRWHKVSRMTGPTAYARRILINLARDDKRRSAPTRPLLGDEAAVQLDDRSAAIANHDEVMRALAQLTPRQRVTIVLRFYEDMTEAQVAEAMDCSIGTVKTQTARALDRLRTILDRPGRRIEANDQITEELLI